MLITSQSYIRDRDHVFDRDLLFDELHHQAKNLLLRFKARVVERSADILMTLQSTLYGCNVIIMAVRSIHFIDKRPGLLVVMRQVLLQIVFDQGDPELIDPAGASQEITRQSVLIPEIDDRLDLITERPNPDLVPIK